MGRKRKSQLLQFRKVALVVTMSEYAYGRKKIQGIIDYYSRHCAWDIYRNEMSQPFVSAEELRDWDGDGIIGEIYDEQTAELIASLGIPFVNTASTDLAEQFPSVMLDNQAIGWMAAKHLIERKLDQFAFVGPSGLWHIQQRFEGFSEAIQQAGGSCLPMFYEADEKTATHIPKEAVKPARLRKLIKELPRPIGIMAASDRVGFAVLEACRQLKIHSPEEVSLVGVDNDSMYCQLAVPSMTSIDSAADQVGFIAARQLDDLMNGKTLKEERVLVSPRRLLPRNSTDMTRSQFPEVARALRFIRRHDHEFIDVSNVLDIVPVSRRWLEMKFKDEVGWGVYHEIRRVHVARAKMLLKTTDWSISRIARESGFKTQLQFDDAFRKLEGMTGKEYRMSLKKRPVKRKK